jgi:O-antigen/teichoic acid export membrane protein
VAATIGSIPILVLGALDSIWLPRIFAVDDEADRDAVLAASRDALFRLLGPVMVGLSVASPLLLRLWAPAQFGTEGLLFLTAVVIVGAVPYAMMLSSRRGLLARSSTVSIAVATLLAVVVDIGSNVVLLPLIGLVGAALATLAAFSVQQACQYLLSKAPRRREGAGRGTLRAGVAGAAALASAALPLSVPGMVVRVVLAVACLVWFARVLIGIAPVRWPVRARRRAT